MDPNSHGDRSNVRRRGPSSVLQHLRLDLSPLRASSEFRLLLLSRAVTLIGSEAAGVALLVQVKQLTGSPLATGLVGAAEVLPVLFFGIYGGLLADRLDRRKVAAFSEAGLGLIAVVLMINAALPQPVLWTLYGAAAGIVALAALQRPSLDAAVPRLVREDDLISAAALMSLSSNASFVIGASLGGFLVIEA